MASEVEVCNLALSNIRGGSINNLSESSLQAQICKLKYPFMRDRMLHHPWGFNRKLKALTPLTVDIFNWAYSYQYPTDCLEITRLIPAYEEIPLGSADVVSRLRDPTIRSLKSTRQQVPYELFNNANNKVIGADSQDLRIDYAAKVTDPNLFSDDFLLALSHLLAAEIAIPIAGVEAGRKLRSDSMTIYQSYIDSAMSKDLNEGYSEPAESEYVTVRG